MPFLKAGDLVRVKVVSPSLIEIGLTKDDLALVWKVVEDNSLALFQNLKTGKKHSDLYCQYGLYCHSRVPAQVEKI